MFEPIIEIANSAWLFIRLLIISFKVGVKLAEMGSDYDKKDQIKVQELLATHIMDYQKYDNDTIARMIIIELGVWRIWRK